VTTPHKSDAVVESDALAELLRSVFGFARFRANQEEVCRAAIEGRDLLLVMPTGAGKSTSLACLIDLINQRRRGNIVTVEDPIEFIHTNKNCVVSQREIGVHAMSFSAALRSVMRQDPDVVMIGEMRDSVSFTSAICFGMFMWSMSSSSRAHTSSYLAWPVKSPSPSSANLFGMVFNAASPQQSAYSLFAGTPSTSSLTGNGDLMSNKVGIANAAVVGASFVSEPSPYDVASWLVATAGQYQEMQVMLMTPSIGGASQIRTGPYTLAFLPAGLARVQYFYDVNSAADPSRSPNRSFASWFDVASGGWKCAAWWGITGTGDWEMLPVDHRVDALLTTGELLSVENGTGRLYSRDGALVATFPLGSLAFIGEEYVGGAARAYFSQCLQNNNRLEFNVYWIATNKLKGLGG